MTSNNIPLHMEIMNILIDKIKNKEYKENEKLPSERQLCDLYGVSRTTIRQTLQVMESNGFISKVHGKGTFVAVEPFRQNLVAPYSFTEEMKSLGKTPTTEVVSFCNIELNTHFAEELNLNPSYKMYKVTRLRLADGKPLMYETSYLPVLIFPNLTKKDLETRPMYDVFNEDYDIQITKVIERFSAKVLNHQEAKYLNITPNQSAMLIKRFAYSEEKLVEYTTSIVRGDKFEYTVVLQ